MASHGLESYAKTQMETAHRGDILVSLFDGALRFAGQAKDAIGRRDPAAKGPAIDRLLAIIMEFSRTLDPSHAPDLARNLQALYAGAAGPKGRAGRAAALSLALTAAVCPCPPRWACSSAPFRFGQAGVLPKAGPRGPPHRRLSTWEWASHAPF